MGVGVVERDEEVEVGQRKIFSSTRVTDGGTHAEPTDKKIYRPSKQP